MPGAEAKLADSKGWRAVGQVMSRESEISSGAWLFVGLVFGLLAVTFVGQTAVLIWEFWDVDWFNIAAVNSHLFLYFPTFGLLALCAFYVPAAVFVDLYWRKLSYGKLRFIAGNVVVIAGALFIAQQFTRGEVPAIWWLHPTTLEADRKATPGCRDGQACPRVSVLAALKSVREVSQTRVGLSPFVRTCDPDPLIEQPAENTLRRHCFATMSRMAAADCCRAQAKLTTDLVALYSREPAHSLTGDVHALLLPFKIYFMLVVLSIGMLLAIWRRVVDRLYTSFVTRIERGILVGAVAIVLWPIANHAFLQASESLYGKIGQGAYGSFSPVFSLAFGAWAILLVMFFFRQHERDLEAAGKIAGAVGGAIAVLKYNEIIDFAVRFVGAGSSPFELAVLGSVLIGAFVTLAWGAVTTPPADEAAALAAQPASDSIKDGMS